MKTIASLSTACLLLLSAVTAQSNIQVAVESGDEVASTLAARWLHGISVEQPSSYHSFLNVLTKLPGQNQEFSAPEFNIVKGLDGKSLPNKYRKISPLFTKLLKPKEVKAFLDYATSRGLRSLRHKTELKTLELAVVSGRANDDLHYMHSTWAMRENELADPRDDCQSWIDVRGHKACTVGEFWTLVGKSQRNKGDVLELEATGSGPEINGYDVPCPLERNDTLPFLVLYGSTTDESFPALYEELYNLAQPSAGSPRAQFAVRWKPDTTLPSKPNRLSHFSAEVNLDVELPVEQRLDDLRIRAIQHVTLSDNPLKALINLVSETPLIVKNLAHVEDSTASEIAKKLNKEDLQPSFTVNGYEIDLQTLDMRYLLESIRVQRELLVGIVNDHIGLSAAAVRAIVLSQPTDSTESDEKAMKLVNLAKVAEGLPSRLSGTAFLEGDASAGDNVLDVPAVTVFLVTDLDSEAGRKAAKTALNYIAAQSTARLSLVHNPGDGSGASHAFSPSNVIGALIDSGNFAETFASELAAWFDLNIGEKGPLSDISNSVASDSPLVELASEGATAAQREAAAAYWKAVAPFVERAGIAPGETAFLVNGRVVTVEGGLTGKQLRTTIEDEMKHRIQPVIDAVKPHIPEKALSDRFRIARLYMLTSSIVAHERAKKPYVPPMSQELPADYPHIVAGKNQSLFEIAVVADPLNPAMRYWAPMLRAFSEVAQIKVFFAKWAETGTELFESVYKSTAPSHVEFGPDGEEVYPSVTFSGLPAGEHDVFVSTSETGTIRLIRDENVKVNGVATRQLTYRYKFGPGEDDEEQAYGESIDDDDDENEPPFTLRPDAGYRGHDEL